VKGVSIPLGKSEVLLAAPYKSPGKAWSDADITELELQTKIYFGR
jgi:hypothetical protein